MTETIQGFRGILDGQYDDIPESCFLFCGGIEDVIEKYKDMSKDTAQLHVDETAAKALEEDKTETEEEEK